MKIALIENIKIKVYVRSYSAGLYRLVGILTLVDLLGTTTCGSGVGNVTGTGFGGIQIAFGLTFTGSDGLLGGVMKLVTLEETWEYLVGLSTEVMDMMVD